MDLLIVLAILLILFAVGGGIFIAKFLWLILIIALILIFIRFAAGSRSNTL